MARYFLIDVDNMKNVANPKEVIDSLNALGVLLSPEETEAKWKDVFNAGNRDGWDEPFPATPYEKKWEELKKTL